MLAETDNKQYSLRKALCMLALFAYSTADTLTKQQEDAVEEYLECWGANFPAPGENLRHRQCLALYNAFALMYGEQRLDAVCTELWRIGKKPSETTAVAFCEPRLYFPCSRKERGL